MENQEPSSTHPGPPEPQENNDAPMDADEEYEGHADRLRQLRRQQSLPQLPEPSPVDTSFSLESILQAASSGEGTSDVTAKVDKRASIVMKLAEENQKLDAELKALTERIAEAERRKALANSKNGDTKPKS